MKNRTVANCRRSSISRWPMHGGCAELPHVRETLNRPFASKTEIPQRLKPHWFCWSYVRAEARTLQNLHLFRPTLAENRRTWGTGMLSSGLTDLLDEHFVARHCVLALLQLPAAEKLGETCGHASQHAGHLPHW